ncbi:thioredoxin [Dictyocaulus viviparus]|uniref:Thioredoxin n=1 Tax=Dictyocaulus viviparus TaxID=29172 RepID=A0A0D8XXQ1_DICVI|nr:thioredoxin [Dictyocaulus viviparus]
MVIRLAILLFSLQRISADVVQLDTSNFDAITKSNDIVFVNFYAEWCRFSQMLKPIFAQASQKFQNLPQGKVVWGAVDADRQAELATRFQVNKYPTLKLFRNGEIVRKEYRSQRSVEALSDFVQKQLDSGINEIQSQDDLKIKLDKNKRNVIAYFSQPSGPDYESLKKVASILREECSFYVGSGPTFSSFTANGPYLLYIGKNAPDGLPFNGDMKQYDFLKQWLTDKCIPLVREITFENAEELTEEGIPFLILFRHPNDKESEKIFTDAVIRELPDQKGSKKKKEYRSIPAGINCLVADGEKFAHPLHHLGKRESDLPVIAIDSFRHMYLFPNANDLNIPGKLRQFVLDLYSGKLHREFHNGPDIVSRNVETQPPPSVFEKLKPSHNRYTLLEKDEL